MYCKGCFASPDYVLILDDGMCTDCLAFEAEERQISMERHPSNRGEDK